MKIKHYFNKEIKSVNYSIFNIESITQRISFSILNKKTKFNSSVYYKKLNMELKQYFEIKYNRKRRNALANIWNF